MPKAGKQFKFACWFGERANLAVPRKRSIRSVLSIMFDDEQIATLFDILSPAKDLRRFYPDLRFFFRSGMSNWRVPRAHTNLISAELLVVATPNSRISRLRHWSILDYTERSYLFSVAPGPCASHVSENTREMLLHYEQLKFSLPHIKTGCFARIKIPRRVLGKSTAVSAYTDLLHEPYDIVFVTGSSLVELLLYTKPKNNYKTARAAVREMTDHYIADTL